MSLIGKLKDLSAIDILQILSVSKRTGVLTVETPEGKNNIVFKNGMIVSASSPSPQFQSLGQTLLERRMIDPLLLEQLLQLQKERGNEPLGSILLEAGAIEEESLREILKERIRTTILSLKDLSEGNFSFYSSEVMPFDDISYDPDEVRVETGWNPQHLLEAGDARQPGRRKTIHFHPVSVEVDSSAPDQTAQPASFVQARDALNRDAPLRDVPLPEMTGLADVAFDLIAEQIDFRIMPASEKFAPVAVHDESQKRRVGTILLIEDEALLRHLLAQRFREKGYEVFQTDNPAEGIRMARQLIAARSQFAIVTDLVMPTSAGGGFLGGLELAEAVRKMNTTLPILMMTDYEDTRAQNRAYTLGLFDFHKKPILTRSSVEDTETRMSAYADLLMDVLRHPPYQMQQADENTDAWKDLKIDSMRNDSSPSRSATNLVKQVNALQKSFREMTGTGEIPELSSSILKYGADFFDRGLLFVMKKGEALGIAGFGETGEIESMPQKARRMKFSLREESIFSKVHQQKRAHFGKLADTPANRQFVSLLGRLIPAAIAMLPIPCNNEPVGLFYGDNAVSRRPLKDLEAFEIFLAQSGLIIQNTAARNKWRTGKFR